MPRRWRFVASPLRKACHPYHWITAFVASGTMTSLRQSIHVEGLSHWTREHQAISRIARQRAVQLQTLGKLRDHRNRGLTLWSLGLHHMAPPTRLGNVYLAPIVIFPENTSHLTLSSTCECGRCHDRRSRFRQHRSGGRPGFFMLAPLGGTLRTALDQRDEPACSGSHGDDPQGHDESPFRRLRITRQGGA